MIHSFAQGDQNIHEEAFDRGLRRDGSELRLYPIKLLQRRYDRYGPLGN